MAGSDEEAERPRRTTKLTEKGLQYQIDVKLKEFNRHITSWRREANKLRSLLGDEADATSIKNSRDVLQNVIDKLIHTQEELSTLCATGDVDDDSDEKLEDIEVEHNDVMKQTLEVLITLRNDSNSSRGSSKKSKKLSSPVSSSKKCQQWVNSVPHDSHSNEQPKSHVDSIDVNDTKKEANNLETQHETVATVIEHLRMTRLPLPEPSIFSGDPLLYPAWKHAFDILVEQSGMKPTDRFFYLQKYLRGDPLELVKGYALLGDSKAYIDAKQALEHRYGDKFIVGNAFRDKLEKWPKISTKDAIGLRKLSDFLRQCITAMQRIENLNFLNDERENRKILAKLPDWLVTRWSRIVTNYMEQNQRFPQFEYFANFIEEEAKIACNPITSFQGLKDKPVKPTPDGRALNMKVAASRTNPSEIHERKKREPFCHLCKKSHMLDDCREFKSKDMADRKRYIQEKGLCFGCLRFGHLAKNCRGRITCKICHKRHPNSLHEERKQEQHKGTESEVQKRTTETQTSSSHASFNYDTANKSTHMKSTMIVPVWISHPTVSGERLVYALLDTQSDTTFILDHTKSEMNLHGVEVNLLLSTMSTMDERVPSERIDGLSIRAYDGHQQINLPSTYTRKFIPTNTDHIPTPDMAMSIPYLSQLADHLLPLQTCEVGLLIGYDCAKALIPRDVIPPQDEDGPYGLRTDLGWSIVGTVRVDENSQCDDPIGVSHRLTACEVPVDLRTRSRNVLFAQSRSVKEEITPVNVTNLLESDFSDVNCDGSPFSQNDVNFMKIMSEEVHRTDDGHYEMPLPFKDNKPNMPNNKYLAEIRLNHLEKKFKQDPEYHKKYSEVIETLIEKGYAEPASKHDTNEPVWYIPHHGVIQPNKLRVVFDCSAKYKGQSLNSHLLTGPDLTNKLTGVLCRFRLDCVAFICDIQEMFHQFSVNEQDRDYLRFLWWKDGNFNNEPSEFRMTVHLFGAASSPGCANFGLKQVATDYADQYGDDVKDFIHHNFYVDDGLKSLPSEHDAVDLISRTKKLCEEGGLHLHKFVSNSRNVLMSVPEKDRAKNVREINLLHDDLPLERALGVQWCVESDSFNFRITLQDKPLTRRGVLSTVMSIYDPLGLLAPVVLTGKQILQDMCKISAEWDDPLPDDLRERWDSWRTDILELESISIKRCYKPDDFEEIQSVQYHHFSDASTNGYGQCTYMRLTDSNGSVHCTLVIGKARVAPLKSITIPRLELTAATVSVKVKTFLDAELQLNAQHVFWTDSKVVLGYINNTERRFHVFVANRIQQIRDHTSTSQWKYVESTQNPADEASRGLRVSQLKDSKWLQGPEMLWKENIVENDLERTFDVLPDDPEVKKSHVNVSQSTTTKFDLSRLHRFSTWYRAKRAIANCLLFISRLSKKIHKVKTSDNAVSEAKKDISVQLVQQAEIEILKHVQKEAFEKEINTLKAIQRNQDLNEK